MEKIKFPQVKGKIIQTIELVVSPDECVIDISFKDRTALSFDVEACAVIVPELKQIGKAVSTNHSNDGDVFTADCFTRKQPRRKAGFIC
jgi:hypothetical protein